MSGLADYFDLRKSFPFYGSYHNDTRNQLVHVAFVPVIFSTALTFFSFVPLIPSVCSVADVAATFYALSFIKMEPTAGLLYAPVIAAMHYVGTRVLVNHMPIAIGLHIVGWLSQFYGHAVFEGRKPALVDNLFQSIHAAVFFVWLEVLFALGYKPALRDELQGLIRDRMKKFETSKRA
jgi:2-hydroxy fatty acid dioxygenase